MFEMSSLMIFMTAALVLLITPGPAVLFIVARSLEQGRLAGIVSVLGISTSGILHVVFSALGLSALLAQSALAFSIVKYVGAIYLIYLGIRTLTAKVKSAELAEIEGQPLRKIFWQGFIVNLFNPKTALFFLSFLPQFVNPARGGVTLQVITLGTIFLGLALVSDSVYALAAGSVRHWLAGNVKVMQRQKHISGVIYIGLGLLTAAGGRSK